MLSDEIGNLKSYYNSFNVVSRFILFPSLRGAPLEDMKPLQIFELANTPYFKAVSEFFDRFVSSPLAFFKKRRVLAWQKLQENNLLIGDNAEENFNVVAGHLVPDDAADALLVLKKAGLLDPTNPALLPVNIDIIKGHQNPASCARGLVILNEHGLHEHVDVNSVVENKYPGAAASGLVSLHKAGLQDPTKPEKAHTNRACLENVQRIETFDLLNFDSPDFLQAIFDVVKTVNSNLDSRLLRVLNHLKIAGLLDPKDLVTANANLKAAKAEHNDALNILTLFGLLDPYNLKDAQTCFDKLVQYSEILIDSEDGKKVWKSMDRRILDKMHWDAILDMCEKNKENPVLGAHEFAKYVDENIPKVSWNEVTKAIKAAKLDCESRAHHAEKTLEREREVNPDVDFNGISQDNTQGGDKLILKDVDTVSAKAELQALRDERIEYVPPKLK